MKLSDFIKKTLEETPSDEVAFDVGIDIDDGEIIVVHNSVTLNGLCFEAKNRLKFTVKKSESEQ